MKSFLGSFALPRREFLACGAYALVTSTIHSSEPIGSKMNPRLFSFIGGDTGPFAITACKTIVGDPLPAVSHLEIRQSDVATVPRGAQWVLRGATANVRYTTSAEKAQLEARQVALGRAEATYGALIPIRKNAAWWALAQDERRAIFEERSRHTTIGLKFLPAIARRLHHCRDLTTAEPFDFVTLFDYAKTDASAFEDLLAALRDSEEWKFVEREVDIRFERR